MHETVDSIADLLQLVVVMEEDQRMEVAIAYMSDNRTVESRLGKIFLCLVDQLREFGYRNAVE